MSKLGNVPISSQFLTDIRSGDGVATGFQMTVAPASVYSILVWVGTVIQIGGVHFTLSNNTINFAAAPPSGTQNIVIVHLGLQPIVAPLNYKLSFYKANGASSNVPLVTNQYIPFFKSNGASSNVPLFSG